LKLDLSKLNYGLSTTLNADEAVARGCGLQCAILSNRFSVKPFTIIDVNPFPVKFTWEKDLSNEDSMKEEDCEMGGEDKEKDMDLDETSNEALVFNRGEEFPIQKRLTFFRDKDFSIDAVYDEKSIVNHPALGNFDIKVGDYKEKAVSEQKTSMDRKEKVRLNVTMNINGLVNIRDAHLLELIQEAPPGDKNEKDPETAPEQNKEGNEKDNSMEEVSKDDDEKPPENEGNNNGEKTEAPVKETPSAPAKKRFKKIGVNVFRSTHAYSQEELNALIESEVNMAQQDRIIKETADARNALESYIYEMRDKVSDYGIYKNFASETEKGKINKDLEDAENWLYDEGFDCAKGIYEERLKALLVDGNKVIFRHEEVQKRSDAEETCKKLINDYRAKLQSNDEKFAHIPDEEKLKAKGEVDECEKWLYGMINEQAAKNTSEDPVLTSSQIYERMTVMTKGYAAIMNKPKPPPPPPPTPDESKTSTEGETNTQSETKEGTNGNGDGENANDGKDATDNMDKDGMDVEPQGGNPTDKMETEEK